MQTFFLGVEVYLKYFKQIYSFEPHPLTYNLLKFNAKNLTIIENCITNYSINPKSNDSKNLTLLFPHRPDPRKGLNLAIEIALGFSKMNHWNKVILKVPKFNVIYDKDAKNSSNYDDDLYEEFREEYDTRINTFLYGGGIIPEIRWYENIVERDMKAPLLKKNEIK